MENSGFTHPGYKRENNEDNFFTERFPDDSCLMAVADGMGGERAGEVASKIAVQCLEKFDPGADIESGIHDLIIESNLKILEYVEERPELFGMGSTMTIAYATKKKVHWTHVGDSRLYLFQKGRLLCITSDHTIPGILLKENEITEEAARRHPMKNMLLKCLGCKDYCEPDTGSFRVLPGDVLIICSDGLYGEITSEEMLSILESNWDIDKTVQSLAGAALDSGGSDNVTVVGLRI